MTGPVFVVIGKTKKLAEQYRKVSLAPLDVLQALGNERSKGLREAIGELMEEAAALDLAIEVATEWRGAVDAEWSGPEALRREIPESALAEAVMACTGA